MQFHTSHRSLTPRGTFLKTQTEYLTKMPDNIGCYRQFILDGYLDVEHVDNACFSILFGLHNETINIYTHLIPFTLIVIKECLWWSEDVNMLNLYGMAMALCFLSSSYYHIGCCRQPSNYRWYLQIDFFGIFCGFFASVLAGVSCYYSCHGLLRNIYLTIDIIVFCFILFPMLFLYPNRSSFKVKMVLFILVFLLQFIAFCHWMYLYNYSIGNWSLLTEFWYSHGGMFGGYFIGGIIWYFQIPERFYPGKFNIFGHSHQLWHLFIVLASFSWWYGLYNMTLHHSNNTNVCLVILAL